MSRWRLFFASRTTIEKQRVKDAFDSEWYRATYMSQSPSDEDPWLHYTSEGIARGNDPAPWFSAEWYLLDHPDVAASGQSAFTHYVLTGRQEMRAIRSSARVSTAPPDARIIDSRPDSTGGPRRHRAGTTKRRPMPSPRDPLHLVSELFDPRYYLAMNADVLDSNVPPFDHFMEFGWREGRDPNAWFSVSFYLSANPDVHAADINPFLHYLSTGRQEGRLARDPLGGWRDLCASLPSIQAQGRTWLTISTAATLSVDSLVRQVLREAKGQGQARLSLILGNDDYVANSGGVQACIATDVAERASSGRATLYLWPVQPLPHLATSDEPLLSARLNGNSIGAVSRPQLARALEAIHVDVAVDEEITVHGLLGHQPRSVRRLIDDSGTPCNRVVFWAHDFFAACSCYTLSPYAHQFCGAPSPSSVQCRVCPYGEGRSTHMSAIRDLLDAPGTLIVTPSEAAAKVFQRSTRWTGPIEVRNLGTFTWVGMRRELPGSERPIRVAFLGYPSPRKGWLQFLEMVRWSAGRSQVEFFHLGSDDQELPRVKFLPIVQLDGDTGTMSDLLRENGIDVVFHWPTWPETYGITAHEALAAGCMVLTNPDSGNISALSVDHRSVVVVTAETFEWMLRRGVFVEWLRSRSHYPARWGSFQLSGIAREIAAVSNE